MSFNQKLVKFDEIRLFDLHCDTLHECIKKGNGEFTLEKSSAHIDLERGMEFNNWVQVFAAWIPDTYRGSSAFRFCVDSLKIAHSAQKKYADKFEIIQNFSDKNDIDYIIKSGKCAAILAVENGSALAGKLENLDIFKSMGVKLITITWNGENELGYGCLTDRNKSKGLKQFGIEAVKRMDEIGIIPDVSHLNEAGFWDVFENTKNSVIASHSVSHAVANHARNLRDDQFRAIIERGGIVGLNLCQSQLGLDEGQSSAELILSQFEIHLSHFLSLGGEDFVALGLDLDGTDLPAGWTGIENVYEIYNFLLRKNYQEKLLSKLFFDNSYVFFTKRV